MMSLRNLRHPTNRHDKRPSTAAYKRGAGPLEGFVRIADLDASDAIVAVMQPSAKAASSGGKPRLQSEAAPGVQGASDRSSSGAAVSGASRANRDLSKEDPTRLSDSEPIAAASWPFTTEGPACRQYRQD